VPQDPPAQVLKALEQTRDYTFDLKKLLASANICDKRWVYEQYDSTVQTNTVQGPGNEAGVMRIKGTGSQLSDVRSQQDQRTTENGQRTTRRERGLAMALAGNGRWAYLDPKVGAMHAVAEAARKVACTGATPVSATNCLNFGNPEKPEIMAQLSAAIDGIAEACTALGTPITGGNVSLYNETKGEGIYPTPVVGIVGIIDDVTKAVPSSFQKAGDLIVLLSPPTGPIEADALRSFGSSEFARTALGEVWGTPPRMQLIEESELHRSLAELSAKSLIHSACDISDGGVAAALAKAGFRQGIGAEVQLRDELNPIAYALFSEEPGIALVTCAEDRIDEIEAVLQNYGTISATIGRTTQDFRLVIEVKGATVIDASLKDLRESWSGVLESQFADEVVTA
jgi:phosphoribosylformylglycinamidine synthase